MTTESILASWGVTKYTIYKDGSVDILQDLDLRDKLTTPEFPIKIRKVTGYLDLRNTPITSLGALKSVSWCLYTDGNKEYEDWEVFQRELESYKSKLSESPEDAPLMLALTEYQWQRACCEEILGG